MRSKQKSRLLWLAACAAIGPVCPQAQAVITFGTGNNYGPAPGNVGIYEGTFDGGYASTPITSTMIAAPAHIFPADTTSFVFDNGTSNPTTYTVQIVASLDDLALWQIVPSESQASTFSISAPIYKGNSEQTSQIVDLGEGYAEGAAVTGGWSWGGGQGQLSWGTNTDTIATNTQLGSSGALGGDFLLTNFTDENPSSPSYNANESTLTTFDSGGGVFIDVNGTYELAGTNTAVDQVYDSSGNLLNYSLYDTYGYYEYNSSNQLVQITTHTPVTSYITRISSKQNFIGLVDGSISTSNAAATPINNDGLLTLYSNLTSGAITGGTELALGGNGTFTKLTIAPNSGVSVLSSLSIPFGSMLDLTNNAIIIDYGSGPDPISSVEQMINKGYNNGGWNGYGIVSSSIATMDAATGLSYGIGFADSADPDNPANLPSGEIEIMFTLLGDANLDGTVNSEDFTLFSENVGQSDAVWDQGDFNYDGTVNSEDFTLFAHNIGQSALQNAAIVDYANANGLLAYIPEPTSVALALIPALSLLRRRTRM
jgi:hypothetical protein